MYQHTGMGGYQSDQLELCTGLLGRGVTSQINQNYVLAYLDGWLLARSTGTYLPAYLDGGLPAGSTGTYVLAYLDGGLPAKSTGTMYRHTYMEVTIHFRWRSCSN